MSPFGVGGIYDFGAESFVAMDTSKWRVSGDPDIRLPRLERILGVQGFRSAPMASKAAFQGAERKGRPIPYARFPSWLFCPKCREMTRFRPRDEKKGVQPNCKRCGGRSPLAPMRFIVVCENGHLAEVPWERWAHQKAKTELQKTCVSRGQARLRFVTHPDKGAGLQSLAVECSACNASHDLEAIAHKDSLRRITRCSGLQPWQHSDFSQPCDQIPQVVQRGASNAYFASVASAIDIRAGERSEESLFEQIRLHPKWSALKQAEPFLDNPGMAQAFMSPLLEDPHLSQAGATEEIIMECLRGDPGKNKLADHGEEDLLAGEWAAFTNPPDAEPGDPFIAHVADLDEFGRELPQPEQELWEEFRKLVAQVTLAKKLRIVKALRGFTRLEPNDERLVSPSLNATASWLPGYEIFGEGIFLSLNPVALAEWEERVPDSALADMVNARKKTTLSFLPKVEKRFVVLHTLSHVLMRQLCFECGYSSSSLAERIYSDSETGMAGILIYTASADSEGALGGLVREGLPDRLLGTLKTALFRSMWCSNDPICSEMKRQGIQGLNKAACHACALAAETSCDHANSLLDRGLLVGTRNAPTMGYFSRFVSLLEEAI